METKSAESSVVQNTLLLEPKHIGRGQIVDIYVQTSAEGIVPPTMEWTTGVIVRIMEKEHKLQVHVGGRGRDYHPIIQTWYSADSAHLAPAGTYTTNVPKIAGSEKKS